MLNRTRIRSLAVGAAAIAALAAVPAAHAAPPLGDLGAAPESTPAEPTMAPEVAPPPPPEVTDVPEVEEAVQGDPATSPTEPSGETSAGRTTDPDEGTPPRPESSDAAVALEVDGADGGYSRQKCERLAQQWELAVDKALENFAASGGFGPQLESAARYLEQASETYEDMSDNCLIVDPQ